MEQGRIHVYTGEGKGKTTAAVGLAVRCAGAGGRVGFLQFDKGGERDAAGETVYNERAILRGIPNIELMPFGAGRLLSDGNFRFANQPIDHEEADKAYERACECIQSEGYELLILDEILVCHKTGLVRAPRIFELVTLKRRHPLGELVLTGRYMPEGLEEKVDLVTEMTERKHYFHEGLKARRGIDY